MSLRYTALRFIFSYQIVHFACEFRQMFAGHIFPRLVDLVKFQFCDVCIVDIFGVPGTEPLERDGESRHSVFQVETQRLVQ